MSIINNGLLLASEAAAAGGYQVSRSLRFNSSDSAYLSRTPASAGNRKTWTWAGWVKRSRLGANEALFAVFSSANSFSQIGFTSGDALEVINYQSGNAARKNTTQVFRDCSAWSHILVAATSSTLSVYFNGSEITAFSINVAPNGADWLFNSTSLHSIGGRSGNNDQYSSLYLADIHFIDGQALTPSSFTEVSATTGQLIPKAYTGSYGTNGFQLKFADNSNNTATTLGKDTSPNGNNWTPVNLSVTAGAGNDSLVDTPTSFGTDTSAGGEVRGNYPTLNPLSLRPGAALSNGNLDLSATPQGGTWYSQGSTMGVSSGSFYWEVTLISGLTSSEHVAMGIASFDTDLTGYHYPGYTAFSYGYTQAGSKVNNVSGSSYGASYTNGDVIGISLNMSTGALVFYKNGTSQGTAFTVDTTKTYQLILGYAGTTPVKVLAVNFGQRPFAYPVSGFKALCDTNLPSPLIAKPNTVMDVALYTGNGSARSITGLGFSPDMVWIKSRSAVGNHRITDIVRGATKELSPDLTNAEGTDANGVTSFDANGFSLGISSFQNGSGTTYAAWTWDAGSSTVTNTQGSITSSVRANASAGFSIVAYTGTGANASVGHGLGVAPSLIIIKARTQAVARNWAVYHSSIGATKILELSTTNAAQTVNFWQDTAPTSTVFTLSSQGDVNASTYSYVAYCFAPVAGYSSFGSYTGNGSADGPFVYTGFRPRWLLIKNASSAVDWELVDTARDTSNGPQNNRLQPNASAAEAAGYTVFDTLSNGFKVRSSTGNWNGSTNTIIYAAFAENPFQYARAR